MSDQRVTQLKYRENTYNVGDCLMLRESNTKILVCKLLEIIPSGGISEFEEWPSIKVQWYFHWSELDLPNLGIPESDHIYLGENELFASDHIENVYIDSILGRCDVFSIKEYDNCEAINDDTYYSRAKFIVNEHRLEPPFIKWETL